MKAMTKHRSHSVAFKRQVAQEFVAGETLHGLSKRHDISRQLIRIWVGKYEAGALDDDVQAADLLQEYEAKIAALERMVGRQALEIEFLKGALKSAPRPRSETTSVIVGRHAPSHLLIRPDIGLRRAGINGRPSAAHLGCTTKEVVMHMIDWNAYREQVVAGVGGFAK